MTSADERVELNRHIGPTTAISIVMGSMIGSGIFVSTKGVIMGAGSIGVTMIIWVVCGLIAMVGSLMYIELGCTMPKAGGDYEYILQSFGGFPAFLFAWTMVFMIIPASNAVAGLTFSDYMLQPFFPCNGIPDSARVILAVLVIMLITFINCLNQKLVSGVQNVFTAGKVLALLVVILMGIYGISIGHTENFMGPFENHVPKSQRTTFVDALYNGLFSYTGWNTLNFIGEEIRNPQRNLPLAILSGISITTVIYILVNSAYFVLLSPAEIIASNAVAVSFGEQLAKPLGSVMAILVAMSVFGYLNGILFATSRIAFSAARQNHMPSFVGLLNVHNHLPICAISVTGFVSILFVCFADVYRLINIASCAEYIFICMSVVGLVVLRKRYPEWNRPFKAPISLAILFILICVIVIIMTFVLIPEDGALALAFIAGGGVLYFVFTQFKEIEKPLSKYMRKVNIVCQKATASAFDESMFTDQEILEMQVGLMKPNHNNNNDDDESEDL